MTVAPINGLAPPLPDFTELFDDELLPVIRRLGERGRGGTELSAEEAATRETVWHGLAGLGALRIGVGALAPVLPLAELLGRALYRSPYFDTLLAADLIAATMPDVWASVSDRIADGELTVAVALRAEGASDPRLPDPMAVDGARISAVRRFVGFVPDVDLLLVLGTVGTGLRAALVAADQPDVVARRQDDVGRGDLYAVRLAGAATVADAPVPPATWAAALAGARLRHAGYLVGLCQGALELSTGRARRRQVFGQPLARCQGPAFRLAELAARTEAVRTMTYQSCVDADAGADAALPACQALLLAGELAVACGAEAIQLHGSYGLTMQCDAQRFYRRAVVDGLLLGTGPQLRRQARELLTDVERNEAT
ncbi:MAG TPA: acyl-CoA dehydrogenase family protein [Pseudonocardiaceae bacterium]|nr:acyl-CoA dehydrogenase family protein [Pseudonocardiaceae bacterium]